MTCHLSLPRGAPTPRVIGIGQPVAGDDGVGLAVLKLLDAQLPPETLELVAVSDPSDLVGLLQTDRIVVLVDALADDGPPGRVLSLRAEALAGRGGKPLSSHGMSVPQAIALAQRLGDDPPEPWIVSVTIQAPPALGEGLTPAVAEAVPLAAEEVLRLLSSAEETASRA